jgi:hypothetical protein
MRAGEGWSWGVPPGPKLGWRWLGKQPAQIMCENLRRCSIAQLVGDQLGGLSTLISKPSFESSFRPISRSKPRARKMRRRLTALAGAAVRQIRGSTTTIAIEVITTAPFSNGAAVSCLYVMIVQNIISNTIVTAACNLCLAKISITTDRGNNNEP